MPTKLFFRVPFVDSSKTPNNELIILFMGFMVYNVAHLVPAVDGMFLVFSLNIKEHFSIIQDRFKECSFINQARNRKIIKELIEYHLAVLEVTEQLSNTFAPIVFAQTCLTSVQVCVIGYQFVRGSAQSMDNLAYISFLCSILIQLFIYCYGGALITSESFNVNLAVQQSQWYNLKPADRTMLVLIMMRAQRPIYIKSMFYDASMESFILVCMEYSQESTTYFLLSDSQESRLNDNYDTVHAVNWMNTLEKVIKCLKL